MTDIDKFKQVNDTYGDQVCDQVLKIFAARIMNQIRKNIDWVVRYGGEEFLIILPETGCAGAASLAERLRQNVRNKTILTRETSLKITASFGGVCEMFRQIDENDIDMDQMINEADEQMYRSKGEGRDRVNIIGLNSL